jgi:molybdopterin molybdotransferase
MDDTDVIAKMIEEAYEGCDAVILSGGVSVGDFDCTPRAMEKAGVEILAHGLALKPGMAGAYGICRLQGTSGDPDFCPGNPGAAIDAAAIDTDDNAGADRIIPVFGLSGNPAACMTAFYAVVLPVLHRLMGMEEQACNPARIRVRLAKDYSRKNQSCRLLRGKVDLAAVVQEMKISGGQGNQVLSSLAGSNAFAEIPAGASVQAGEAVDAFLIGEI